MLTGPDVEVESQRQMWCNGNFDYLQVDGKAMANFSDISSKQNRFCGNLVPPNYVSDRNVLYMTMKSNGDDLKGKGFQLRWEAVSGMTLAKSIYF